MEKLRKNSTAEFTSVLADSKFFNDKKPVKTSLPILNIAFSGEVNGGFRPGLTMIAGPSRCFKSSLALFAVKSYLDEYPDGVCIYYDSEFGAPPAYLESFGIDTNRVLHVPVMHLEQLKFDISKQLDELQRGENVIIFIDSVGNIASKKETEDAIDQKSVADMSRAKAMKSMWRIVTPTLTAKNVPCIAINHTYESQGMYPTQIVSGGTGGIYSSDTIFIVSRAQEKEGTELEGYRFTINIEKSRFVKEKSKFPFVVKFDKGINRWSGLLDLALEFDLVTKPKMGWYTRPFIDGDKNWRAKETDCREFWEPVFKQTNFAECIKNKYQIAATPTVQYEEEDLGLDD